MSKNWYVYILTNYTNTVLYIGITNDLLRRIYEHKRSLNQESFSHKYRLYKLVWFETFPSPTEAIIIEKRLKGWRRDKKLDLIRKTNTLFKDLFSTLR